MENENKKYDLIIAIVNKGYTDLVMEASRKAGARGGTIMTARGTGNADMESFYGIAIQPEKEVVLILADRELTDKVLNGIYESAGLKTNGQGIAFALPAGRTTGITAANVDITEFKKEEEKAEEDK